MSFSDNSFLRNFLNNTVRQSTFLTRLLFGIQIRQGERINWDFTTLVLRRALLRTVETGNTLLEIGTGPYALLSLFISRKRSCRVEACDINPAYVESARRSAQGTTRDVHIVQSDLFENVEGQFDVLFSNTLYVPKEIGLQRGFHRLHEVETDWCGGETGYEYIERLLDNAPAYLHEKGTLLLGFNHKYLDRSKIEDLCIRKSYRVVTSTRMLLNPSTVFHLQLCS